MHFPPFLLDCSSFCMSSPGQAVSALGDFFPAHSGFESRSSCGCSCGKSSPSPLCRDSVLGRSSQDSPGGWGTPGQLETSHTSPSRPLGGLSMEGHEPGHLRGIVSSTHPRIPPLLISISPALVRGNLGPLAPSEALPTVQGLCRVVSSHSHEYPLLCPTSPPPSAPLSSQPGLSPARAFLHISPQPLQGLSFPSITALSLGMAGLFPLGNSHGVLSPPNIPLGKQLLGQYRQSPVQGGKAEVQLLLCPPASLKRGLPSASTSPWPEAQRFQPSPGNFSPFPSLPGVMAQRAAMSSPQRSPGLEASPMGDYL